MKVAFPSTAAIPAARSVGAVRSGGRKRIALLMNDAGLAPSYQGDLRRGVEEAVRSHDLDLWVYGGRMYWASTTQVDFQVFDLVDQQRLDGIVLAAGCISSYLPARRVYESVAAHCPVPICAVGERVDGVHSIYIDNAGGAEAVVEHVVSAHARKHVAFIAGPEGHQESEERRLGTERALRRHGLELRPEATAHGNFGPGEARRLLGRMLDEGVVIDAVITVNDDTALGALDALQERGVDVPGQVSVTGFDDAPHSASGNLTLTTVHQPVRSLGHAAVKHLRRRWEGDEVSAEVTRLDTHVVLRRSCGCEGRALSRRPSKISQRPTPSRSGRSHRGARARPNRHASLEIPDIDPRNRWLLREFQTCWDRLATALTLPDLKSALLEQLPRLGIEHAWVALFSDRGSRELVPLLGLQGGVEQVLPDTAYRASLVLPPEATLPEHRASLTVLPLTFEAEPLGLAALELPLGMGIYALLREQIGSAIQTVRMHQKVLNRERQHAQLQEEKRVTAERLKSLSQLAAGVAHDLNNVLGPIIALPDMIQEDLRAYGSGVPPRAVSQDLDTIREAGRRATETIQNLLILGRINEVSEAKPLDLNAWLQSQRDALLESCAERAEVHLDVSPGQLPLRVRICESRLRRAVGNLVHNSLMAIEAEGTVAIRTRSETRGPGDRGDSLPAGRYAVLEVTDSGAGIATQHLDSVLEPFFSAPQGSTPPGVGLGLAIVHRIAQDAGGGVSIVSEPGQGTTVRLHFPELDPVVSVRAPSSVCQRNPGGRILVVDDESIQLRTARRLLSGMGYEVVTARSGDEAVAAYASDTTCSGFDLAIVDMLMPGALNGIGTIEALRRRHPNQKALIVSGYAPERMDAEARARGLPWLAKPYTPDGLAAAVHRALSASA